MIGAPLMVFFGLGGALFWLFLPKIGIGQIWVAVSLLLLVIYGAITWRVSRSRARRERVISEGLPGFATILEAEGTGVLVNRRPQVRLRLRVELPGRAPYEAEVRDIPPFLGLESVGPQRRVPIFVDRDDTSALVIDWGSISATADGTLPGAPEDAAGKRLEALQDLRRRGLITQAEYEQKRQRILDQL